MSALKGRGYGIRRLRLSVPDIDNQRVAVAVIDRMDEAIGNTEALIAKYERIRVGLTQDLLTRGIDEHGRLRDPSTHEFKPSSLGPIPSEWSAAALDDQIKVIDCKHYTPQFVEGGYAFVRPRNVKIEGLDLTDVDFVSRKDFELLTDKHRPGIGDIVFSRNASFGVACYVSDPTPFAIGQDTVIMTRSNAATKFVYYYLASALAERQVRSVSTGSTFGRIDLGQIRKLPIPVPPKPEQTRIAEMLDTAVAGVKTLRKSSRILLRRRTGLMRDLLGGRIPAEPLLATEATN